MPEKSFTKIKYDGSKMRIEYEVERGDSDPDEFALLSTDKPEPEFDSTLQALTQDVLAICELPAGDADKIKVRGVSLTYTNGIMGACITALKTLETANAPLVLNTPHLPSEPYSEGDALTLDPATVGRLSALVDRANRYVDGHRAQQSLFEDEEAKRRKLAIEDGVFQ